MHTLRRIKKPNNVIIIQRFHLSQEDNANECGKMIFITLWRIGLSALSFSRMSFCIYVGR